MHMLRLPIKYIEKFRRYKAEPAESQNKHHSEAALIEMVMRRPGQDACREIRMAIADILKGREIDTDLPKDRSGWDGKPYWVFTPNRVAIRSNQVAQLVRYRKSHPSAIYGIDVEKEYATPLGKVCVYGKVAALEGAEILDPRPIFESVKTANLIDQASWQFFLDATGCKTYHFDLFEVRGYNGLQFAPYDKNTEPDQLRNPHASGRQDDGLYAHNIGIMEPERYTFHAYPTMHEQIAGLVAGFVDWAATRVASPKGGGRQAN